MSCLSKISNTDWKLFNGNWIDADKNSNVLCGFQPTGMNIANIKLKMLKDANSSSIQKNVNLLEPNFSRLLLGN